MIEPSVGLGSTAVEGMVTALLAAAVPDDEAVYDPQSNVPWIGYPIPYPIAVRLDPFCGLLLMVIRWSSKLRPADLSPNGKPDTCAGA